jgi:hypothetical protein
MSMVRQDASGLLRVLNTTVDGAVFQALPPWLKRDFDTQYALVTDEDKRCLFDDAEAPELMYPSARNLLEVCVGKLEDEKNNSSECQIHSTIFNLAVRLQYAHY